MEFRHFAHWPPGLPRSLAPADTTLQACLEATARRYPDKAATIFQDETLSWAEIRNRVTSGCVDIITIQAEHFLTS